MMPEVYVYVACCGSHYFYKMSLISGEYLVNVHYGDIPHTFIMHFPLHSAEKIHVKFSANYPLTTFHIPHPQNAPSLIKLDSQPFRSRANSLPGANRPIAPWPICNLELSLPGAKCPGNLLLTKYIATYTRHESSRERNGQGANWPRSYWPIRSWERIDPGAKRLGTRNLYVAC